MMFKVLGLQIVTIVLCFYQPLFAQSFQYPKGVYLSFDEVKQKSPGLSIELEIKKRTKGDIKMNGGNDYKLFKRSIASEVIEEEYFGYSDGDTLYINCIHYKIQNWYMPVLSDGKFLILKGGLSMQPQIQREQMESKAQIGYMFGAVGGGIQGASNAMLRFIYAIDKETNQIYYVSKDFLKELLKSNTELMEQFAKEEDVESQEVILKYLNLLNKIVP